MIGSLSGGNQQKVVIGKMLATNPSVVLLDEPSRGIDIGAKAEVFRLLAEGAKRGLAVVYSTSEVGECLSVAHRIIVMAKGKISAEFGPDVTKERIMAASGEVDLEHQLADAHGLDLVTVVTDLHQDELPLEALGLAGASFLAAEIARRRTQLLVGVSHGRTLLAARREPRRRAGAARPRRVDDGRPHPGRRRQPARDRHPPRRAHRRRGDGHAGAVHGQQRRRPRRARRPEGGRQAPSSSPRAAT